MLLLLFCASLVAASPENHYEDATRFDGYQVLAIVPANEDQTLFVHSLKNDIELDFYTEARYPGMEASVLVPPHKLDVVKGILTTKGIQYSVVVENYQTKVDELHRGIIERYEKNGGRLGYDKDRFNSFDDVLEELEVMQSHCPAGFDCVLENIGYSVENRPLILLKVSKGEDRDALWFDSMIHAREWLALTTLMRMLDNFIYNYGSDPDATRIMDKYDMYFLPIFNPDGYVYSWNTNVNWRKSRNINPGSSCMGTDLNRNHDFMWGNIGSSTNPCSNTFRGRAPADQLETQHVQNKLSEIADNVKWATSIHCQGRMWLIPYGHVEGGSCAYPDDYDDLLSVADATADAIQAVHGTTWTRGSICSTIYAASGGTCDWMYAIADIKYSSTPELRSSQTEADIIPSGEEVWQGVVEGIAKMEEIENYRL